MLIPQLLHKIVSVRFVHPGQNVFVFFSIFWEKLSSIAHIVDVSALFKRRVFGGSCGLFIMHWGAERKI